MMLKNINPLFLFDPGLPTVIYVVVGASRAVRAERVNLVARTSFCFCFFDLLLPSEGAILLAS